MGRFAAKFNGVSDACILVDKNTNDIYIAGLWMHGALDDNGKWIEGLNEIVLTGYTSGGRKDRNLESV